MEGTKLMTDVYSCNIMYILLAKIQPQKLKFIHEIGKIYINHAYEKGSRTLKHCEDHRLCLSLSFLICHRGILVTVNNNSTFLIE